MKPICPSCHQEIPVEDVDLDTGLGRCRFCNEIFEIAELVGRIREARSPAEQQTTKKPPVRPGDSRIRLIRKDHKLLIYVPPAGFFSPALFLLGFSIFWLAFIALWTAGALGLLFFIKHGPAPKWENIAFACFSIPFWLVGLGLLGGSIGAMFSRYIVYLDSSHLERRWQCLFLKSRKRVSREAVQMARPFNALPKQRDSLSPKGVSVGVEIVYQGGTVRIPCRTQDEQEWLLWEVNHFLETTPYRPSYLVEEPLNLREWSSHPNS